MINGKEKNANDSKKPQALLDIMTYSYTVGTNKISSIADAGNTAQGGFRAASGAMTYQRSCIERSEHQDDANGNMISNAAKGITSILYNHLNLPNNITITGGKTIDFTYQRSCIECSEHQDDANGNTASNAAKGITSISYNHLNLPSNLTITGGKTIDYTYTADGKKLRKVVKTGVTINSVQEYVFGIEYKVRLYRPQL